MDVGSDRCRLTRGGDLSKKRQIERYIVKFRNSFPVLQVTSLNGPKIVQFFM